MDLIFFDRKIDGRSEIELLLNNFRNRIGFLKPYTSEIIKRRVQDFNRREELLFYCPYWLTEICKSKFTISKLRKTVLANLLEVVHVTIQDKLIDNEKIVGYDFVTLSLKSNLLFLEFTTELNEIYHQYPLFKHFLRKYFNEFTHATIHERENHWGKFQNFEKDEMIYLGHKFAPVKIACAGMLILGNNVDAINNVENLIDDYYTGHQLIDDIEDWKEDSAVKNFTYFINQLNKKVQLTDLSNIDEKVLRKTIIEVVGEAELYFQKALNKAKNLQLLQLSNHIKRKIEQINLIYRNEKSFKYNTGYCVSQNVLQFDKKNKSYIYNTYNKAFAEIDKTTKRFITSITSGSLLDTVHTDKNREKKAEFENIASDLFKHNFIVKKDGTDKNIQARGRQLNGIHPIIRLEIELSPFNIQKMYEYLELFFQSCTGNYNKEIILIYTKSLELNIIDVVSNIVSIADILHQNIKIQLILEEQAPTGNLEEFISCRNIYSVGLLANAFKIESLQKTNYSEKVKYFFGKDFNLKPNKIMDYILSCSLNLQEIQYFNQKFNWCKKYFNSTYKSDLEKRLNNRTFNCNAGISSLCITRTGEIIPCYWHKAKVSKKDMFSFDAIRKIQITHLYRQLAPKCQECKIVNLCAGGCQYEERDNQFCHIQLKDFEEIIIEKNVK